MSFVEAMRVKEQVRFAWFVTSFCVTYGADGWTWGHADIASGSTHEHLPALAGAREQSGTVPPPVRLGVSGEAPAGGRSLFAGFHELHRTSQCVCRANAHARDRNLFVCNATAHCKSFLWAPRTADAVKEGINFLSDLLPPDRKVKR